MQSVYVCVRVFLDQPQQRSLGWKKYRLLCLVASDDGSFVTVHWERTLKTAGMQLLTMGLFISFYRIM